MPTRWAAPAARSSGAKRRGGLTASSLAAPMVPAVREDLAVPAVWLPEGSLRAAASSSIAPKGPSRRNHDLNVGSNSDSVHSGRNLCSIPRSHMQHIVHISNLVKHYFLEAATVRALDGVSLTVDRGEFVALMGPSGSGKSTLLNLLGCLDRPTRGHYFLDDEDVSEMDDDQLSDIRSKYLGFIFQSYNLLPQYTVVENIAVPLMYQERRLDEASHRRCLRLADVVGLGNRTDHRPMQLSGGQQQRVAIARALVNDPHVILADEPTGNLDSHTSDEIMTMLAKLNAAGKTIIMVTHENDIAAWAKRVIRLRDGLVESDECNGAPKAALKHNPAFMETLNAIMAG